MRDRSRFYFKKALVYDETAVKKHLKPEAKAPLEDVLKGLEEMPDPWDEAGLEALFGRLLEKHGIKMIKLAMPVRVALTGGAVSPGIFDVVRLLGRTRSLERLQRAIAKL